MSKIVLITGATSGFGEAMALNYAEAGYKTIITGRRKDRLETLAARLKTEFNTTSLILSYDVQNKEESFQAIESIPEEWRGIDVLINNAGLAAGRDYFDEASLSDWETMIDTNVKGLIYTTKAVLPYMIARQKGHIINIGSTAGKEVYEKGNAYCATKFAVNALSQSMRIDLLRHKIKVTCINPGAAETEFSLVRFKGDAEQAAKVYEGYQAMTADDIAKIALYCSSLPSHLCINDLVVTSLAQANSFYTYKGA